MDVRDILTNPRSVLSQLCAALGLPFQESMLHWPPGLRDTDGIWAKHWYNAVEKSTGFQPYNAKNKPLLEHLRKLYEAGLPFTKVLRAAHQALIRTVEHYA